MLVLIDLEWDEPKKYKRFVTQLSAIRVNEDWTIVDRFSSIVIPSDKNKYPNWCGVAYQGYPPEKFLAGESEKDSYFRFQAWLHRDDILCCNGNQTELTLHFLHNRHEKQNPYINHCVYARAVLNQKSSIENASTLSLYQLAEKEGICAPKPEHCSENDVTVLYQLFLKLNISIWQLYQSQRKKVKETLPLSLRNKSEIILRQFRYVYAKNSEIYHTNDCRLVLNTKNLCGCKDLSTLGDNRRPCLRCKPDRIERNKKYKADQLSLKKVDVNFPSLWRNLHPREDISGVILINGEKSYACWKNIIGYCNYTGHPGMLDLENVKRHECFSKKCVLLTVNPLSDYWLNRGSKKNHKNQKIEQLRLEKEMIDRTARREELLKTEFQSKADQTKSNLLIVHVTVINRQTVRINYVSENSYADGNLFPSFLESIKENHPQMKVVMRHICDVQGRFVTKKDFLRIKQLR